MMLLLVLMVYHWMNINSYGNTLMQLTLDYSYE